jgi:hypothetical protein
MVRTFWLMWAVVLLGCAALEVAAQGAYAVQVAVTQAQAEAEAMVKDLQTRGLHAYWLGVVLPDGSRRYRVRIGGKFPNRKSAQEFGGKLAAAKVIGAFEVFGYEAPSQQGDNLGGEPVKISTGVPPAAPVGHAIAQRNPAMRGEEFETVRPQKSPQVVTLPAQPGKPARSAKPQAKHADEVELEDFKEFAPPTLLGTVEAVGGRLRVSLQNTNTRHAFRGRIKLTLRAGEQVSEEAPMQISVGPGQEYSFDLAPGVGRGGSYSLAVYDERNALHLLQSAQLESGAAGNVIAQKRSAGFPANAAVNPANGELMNGAPGRAGDVPPDDEEPEGSKRIRTGNYPDGKPDEGSEEEDEPLAGDAKVVVRQIAASAENLTLEFEILAKQPLGMIMLSVVSGGVSDTKQAIMTTKHGRIPFLIPANEAIGALSYELKEESGRVLAAGRKSFQEIAQAGRGN